jgi:hypothetical protein
MASWKTQIISPRRRVPFSTFATLLRRASERLVTFIDAAFERSARAEHDVAARYAGYSWCDSGERLLIERVVSGTRSLL